MDPLTAGIGIFSALKSSGSGGTSQMPNLTATSGANPNSNAQTGTVTNSSGMGLNMTGSVFWLAAAAIMATIGYVIVKEI